MGIVIVIVVLALLFGVLGAVLEGLLWLLFIGIALLVVAFFVGRMRRGQSRAT